MTKSEMPLSSHAESTGSAPFKPARTVNVSLGARSYDILIGPGVLEAAGAILAPRFPGARLAIVTDENVAATHLPTLERSLSAAGIDSTTIIVAAGEASKSFDTLQYVVDEILKARLERSDVVIALGGGVVGDLTGFAASIARRGMPFVQIPSTLLAQVDSSVGGKTGINSSRGKNLVGAFHQPALVLADTDILSTLPIREFRAGYAEVVKYGLINDPDFFDWLCANWQHIFEGGPARIEAVARCCQAKADVVAADELEAGSRALLNLGHTFGHALEAATGFSRTLIHGEGVAIGMAMAFRFSQKLGLCGENASTFVTEHLRSVGLPTSLEFFNGPEAVSGTATDLPAKLAPSALLDHIRQDKKVSRGALTFILTGGIGASYVANDVDADTVFAFLEDEQPTWK